MLMEGKYEFLSNFYPCKITDVKYPDIIYDSTEAAFQAAKVTSKEERIRFIGLRPGQAKRLGRRSNLRPDWEEIKDTVMETYLRQKFSNPDLASRLISVTEPIVEDNYWHDTYWGRCNGIGKNMLGQLLTKIRNELVND